ncbi:hypothetical protein ACJJTC_005690 [Scirpophaga incertulas]
MATVSELKKNRQVCRAAFTVAVKNVEQAFDEPNLNLESYFEILEERAGKLFQVDEALKLAIVTDDKVSEEDMMLILDIEETTNRETRFKILKAKSLTANCTDKVEEDGVAARRCCASDTGGRGTTSAESVVTTDVWCELELLTLFETLLLSGWINELCFLLHIRHGPNLQLSTL